LLKASGWHLSRNFPHNKVTTPPQRLHPRLLHVGVKNVILGWSLTGVCNPCYSGDIGERIMVQAGKGEKEK
jgi:hypothetical protein